MRLPCTPGLADDWDGEGLSQSRAAKAGAGRDTISAAGIAVIRDRAAGMDAFIAKPIIQLNPMTVLLTRLVNVGGTAARRRHRCSTPDQAAGELAESSGCLEIPA